MTRFFNVDWGVTVFCKEDLLSSIRYRSRDDGSDILSHRSVWPWNREIFQQCGHSSIQRSRQKRFRWREFHQEEVDKEYFVNAALGRWKIVKKKIEKSKWVLKLKNYRQGYVFKQQREQTLHGLILWHDGREFLLLAPRFTDFDIMSITSCTKWTKNRQK